MMRKVVGVTVGVVGSLQRVYAWACPACQGVRGSSGHCLSVGATTDRIDVTTTRASIPISNGRGRGIEKEVCMCVVCVLCVCMCGECV
jgi:hypothetical protein